MNIEKEYNFKIWKEDDWYLAEMNINNEDWTFHTQGRNEQEIFEMIADAFLAAMDIPCSKWSRFWHKLLRIWIYKILSRFKWFRSYMNNDRKNLNKSAMKSFRGICKGIEDLGEKYRNKLK